MPAKEPVMDIADFLIHVHSELSDAIRSDTFLEQVRQ